SIVALCLIILILVSAGKIDANTPSPEAGFKVTTVFLVRHAEKATTPPEDPPLTEAGNIRAQQLARILEQAGIKAIYTSQFLRTKQTAEPLAKSLGITPALIPVKMSPSNPREVSEQSIRDITDKIFERAGEAALVVGHSNTVPEVIKMLGADQSVTIDEKEFDNLFVVTVYARGKAKVARLKY
ncbi:MAG TPA: phosphoglycerate mutase family protein, partial [Blastocatellia bacterium]